MSILFSPLEQFEILPLLHFNIGIFDISITNQTIILFLAIFLFFSLFYISLNHSTFSLSIIPNRLQVIIEYIYVLILSMVVDNINGKTNESYFPLVFTVFFFIISLNLIGLVPYSFTVTSHFITTLALSLIVFIGMNIICVKTHGLEFFSLFLPSGTSFALSFLLVPIELISYIFKPISLAIRLFCNIMAGHTLLKVFVGFAWSLMSFSGALCLLQIVPLALLIPLFILEFGVAIIQAFVFSLLTCIYLNDAINFQ